MEVWPIATAKRPGLFKPACMANPSQEQAHAGQLGHVQALPSSPSMCILCVAQKPRDFRIIFIYFIFFVLFAGCINEWMVEISYRFKLLCVCVERERAQTRP